MIAQKYGYAQGDAKAYPESKQQDGGQKQSNNHFNKCKIMSFLLEYNDWIIILLMLITTKNMIKLLLIK
jgi:hypothetical protein